MLNFFKDNNVKIHYTNSNLKAVVIERFNRSLRELMMKEFVKNNNTIWYNILPKLIKFYNNRYHNTIKNKPININKSNKNRGCSAANTRNTYWVVGLILIPKCS